MSDSVLVELAGGVATLTLNRPESLNALNQDMMRRLSAAVHEVEHDALVRCVVVRGAGSHFLAGGDIQAFKPILDEDQAGRRAAFEHMIHEVHPAIVAIRRMGKPVLASVQGAAAGFGMSLMLACDLVIAADNSFYTTAYLQLGTTPDGGGTFFLPRVVGLKKATELMLLAERIDAQTALGLGLINRVVPLAELEQETHRLAERLARGPTRAYANAKRLLNASVAPALQDQLDREAVIFADCATTEDFAEGVNAFLDKRRPNFHGR